jgi:hypothetical protein
LCEQAHHPRRQNQLHADFVLVQMLYHLVELGLQEPLQDFHVLVESWEILLVDELEFVVLDEVEEEGEGDDLV